MLARRADARYFRQGWLPHISTSSASIGVLSFVSIVRSRQIAMIPSKIIFVDSKISQSVLSFIVFVPHLLLGKSPFHLYLFALLIHLS